MNMNIFKVYDETKQKDVWRLWFVLFVELFGTFAMVFEIIAPSALDLGQYDWYNMIFGTFIMKSFWVAGFILLLIFVLRKVSVNLNPAVTLSEIATGHHTWTRGIEMIVFQFIGAFLAAFLAYGSAVWGGTWQAFGEGSTGSTLDAVYPRLIFSNIEVNWFGFKPSYMDFLSSQPSTNQWPFAIVSYIMEFSLTFALIASVIYGKKIGAQWGRPFTIFGTLMVIVFLGIHTNNIALNPARLYAPAVVSQVMGGAQTLQFTWIFLFGELTAVALVFYIETIKNTKAGNVPDAIKKELGIVSSEAIITKIRYEWVLSGKKQLENMTKEELISEALELNSPYNPKGKREEIEYDIIEFLIFGKEEVVEDKEESENKKEKIKKEKNKKEKSEEIVLDKNASKTFSKDFEKNKLKTNSLSNEEIEKRNDMRNLLKTEFFNSERKSLLEDYKNIEMTKIFGIDEEIKKYFEENNILDILKLSNVNPEKLSEQFISGFPEKEELTFEIKKEKIIEIIKEAKYIVKELIKNPS